MFLGFLFGAFGAIVAEVLKRWQQWNALPEKRFLALLNSIEFWGGLRGTLAAAEHPLEPCSGSSKEAPFS